MSKWIEQTDLILRILKYFRYIKYWDKNIYQKFNIKFGKFNINIVFIKCTYVSNQSINIIGQFKINPHLLEDKLHWQNVSEILYKNYDYIVIFSL